MATSLELDDETRNSVYYKFNSLTAKEAYNELSSYTRLNKDEKAERWPEVWYAICFMQSSHRTKLLELLDGQPAWKKVDSDMYTKVAELQRNRAKYDPRIKPFRTHETNWKCPYPECKQENKDWEDVYSSCSHLECTGKEQVDKPCGFHIPCLFNAAEELNNERLNGKSKKRKAEDDDRNHYKTPQKQKRAKNVPDAPPSLNRTKRRSRDWEVSSESDTEESDTGERKSKRARNKLTPSSEDDSDSDSKFNPRMFPGLPRMGGRKEKGKKSKDKPANKSY